VDFFLIPDLEPVAEPPRFEAGRSTSFFVSSRSCSLSATSLQLGGEIEIAQPSAKVTSGRTLDRSA
jgi:hypothetical protein